MQKGQENVGWSLFIYMNKFLLRIFVFKYETISNLFYLKFYFWNFIFIVFLYNSTKDYY